MNNSVAPTHWVIKWYSKKRENWVISKSRAHSWYSPENNTNKREKEIKSTFHYTGCFHGKRSCVSGSLDSMREKQRTVSSHSVLSRFLTVNLLFGTVKQDRMTFIGNVTRLSWNSDNGMQSNHGMCRLLIRNKVTPPRLKFQSDWANLMGTEFLHGAILIGLLFDLICIIAPGENQRWTLGLDN